MDDFEDYLDEKFPKQEDTGLDYSDPMSAAEQIRVAKAAVAKKNIPVNERFRRLKSGRKFD